MTEDEKQVDLESLEAKFTIGVALLIWAIAFAAADPIIFGMSASIIVPLIIIIFPIIGAYLTITSIIEIQIVLRKEQS